MTHLCLISFSSFDPKTLMFVKGIYLELFAPVNPRKYTMDSHEFLVSSLIYT
jgi:hypothetical protein